jgi:HK97 family phage major capsid protein
MRIQDLLTNAERALGTARARRENLQKRLSDLGDQSKQRELTSVEAAEAEKLLDERAVLDGKIPELVRQVEDLKVEQRVDDRINTLQDQVYPTDVRKPGAKYDEVVRIGSEAGTYRPDYAQTGEPSFLQDLARAQVYRDPAAGERLARHQREMAVLKPGWQDRAVGTGAVVGLVPPAYLTDEFAALARAGRPLADACHKLPLPPQGMTVNISRITTGSSAAVQTAENSAVSETNIDDTLLTVPVNTISGQQTVSRQAIERGALVEQVLMADLAGAHNAQLDVQVANGTGSSGQHLGILNTSGITSVTYTDASPTVPELWPKMVDAVRQVAAVRFTGATHVAMNPLLWGWHLASLDTTGRPLFDVGGSNSPMNMVGGADGNSYQDGGTLLGCKLVQSGAIPSNLGAGTNETRVIAGDFRDIYLWEDPGAPIFIRAEQPAAASLGVLFVVYSYSAFSAGRQPKGVSVISGTGLIPQAL